MRCSVFVLIVYVFQLGICKNNHHKSVKYYTKQTEIVIPMMMHLDHSLTKIISKEKNYRIREKFKLLAKDMLRDVEDVFARRNLHQKLRIMLLDVKIIKNNKTNYFMHENVSKYLKNYCEWQGGKKVAKKKWYYSVLFTGLDLYYVDKFGAKVRSSTGRGYMRGVCSTKNSCAVLEWHPQYIAFLLAHEIAHSLGIPHDGPPYNDCQNHSHIMAAKYNSKNLTKTWSSCNKEALNQFLKSKNAWCLRENSPITLD